MSRIGNKIITVPEGVTVEIADDNTVTVTGSKGTLVKQFSPVISFNDSAKTVSGNCRAPGINLQASGPADDQGSCFYLYAIGARIYPAAAVFL